MKACRIFSRNIRDSFRGVIRNFSLSLASVSCITITLIVVAIAIALSYNVNNFANSIEKDMTIVVFMDTKITDEEKDDVLEGIKKIDGVVDYTFQSKIDITKDMTESAPLIGEILANYTEEENPLQPTYQVKVEDIEKISKIAKKIEKLEHVKTVKYGEGMVEKLVSVFNVVKKISVGMVIALIVVTAFLISNTIKITILSRKREIEIMRLVGASNLNIKIPFILEGLFLGILGSIIPILITTYGYTTLYKNFDGQFLASFIELINPTPFIYSVSGVLVLIGIAVGMFGSWRAVKKHMKV